MPFEDNDFPPTDASIGEDALKDLNGAEFQWVRCADFAEAPVLLKDGVEPGDICQGSLGDCWFLGALSVMATRSDLLASVVPADPSCNSEGKYTFNIYKFGEWHAVTIDDLIPCNTRGPIFATSLDQNEMWVILLEKAYAKLHTSYGALIGGWVTDALVDMTGGTPNTIMFEDHEDEIADGTFWKMIRRYYASGEYLMGCARSTSGQRENDEAGQGILAGHAYGILNVQEVDGNRLIKCRNPWGSHEWTGKWSDQDTENWTDDIKEKLQMVSAEDGAFWIEFDDFVQQYNKIYVCRLFDASWNRVVFKTEWVGETAGGCTNHDTWVNNVQYVLDVPEKTEVVMNLQTKDSRITKTSIYSGFCVYQAREGEEKVESYRNPVAKTPISNMREATLELLMEPGRYCIMPFTFEADVEAEYVMSVFSRADITVTATNGISPIDNLPPVSSTSRPVDAGDVDLDDHDHRKAVGGGDVDDSHDGPPPSQGKKTVQPDDPGHVGEMVAMLGEKLQKQYPMLKGVDFKALGKAIENQDAAAAGKACSKCRLM